MLRNGITCNVGKTQCILCLARHCPWPLTVTVIFDRVFVSFCTPRSRIHAANASVLSKLLHQFQLNSAQHWIPPCGYRGWSKYTPKESKMVDGCQLNLRISTYCLSSAIKAIMGLVALTALGMNWTEDDTVKTTMNGISNITFIELRHVSNWSVEQRRRTDGRVFSLPRPRSDRPDEAAPLALHYGGWLWTH